jgi:hypothetical protein
LHQNARRVALNVIANFVAYLGWTTAMGSFVATFHWIGTAPRAPDFSRGAVFEYNNHGSILYFTAHQQFVVWGGLLGGLLLFALGFAVLPKRDVVYRTGFLAASMRFQQDDPEGVRFWARAAGIAGGLMVASTFDPTWLGWCFEHIRAVTGAVR